MSAASPAIGYSTLRDDPSGPGDRRRFCHYAARRGLGYEIARPGRRYDVVVSSVGGDLGEWSRLPRSTRLVFDMVDSYLAEPRRDPRGVLRGVAKFAFRHTRRLHVDFRALIEATCRRADAVICSTEEQRQDIRRYCSNVHVILDFHTEMAGTVKQDYRRGEVFNLVWEGLPGNLVTFAPIAETLRTFARSHPTALHLITGVERALGSTHILMQPTKKLVRRIFAMEGVYLYEWNLEMLPRLATACDLAVIPIPLDHPFFRGKPENKLVIFWRMGLPVLASATPAYTRAMQGAGLEMTCRDADDWMRLLTRYREDEAARAEAGRRGRAYAESAYSEATLLERWDRVFASIGLPTAGSRA